MATYTEYDIKKMSDTEILDKLNTFGINITIDKFKEVASEIKSPSRLAHVWSSHVYDFCYTVISELWERHLIHEKNPEILADLVDDIINTYEDSRDKLDREVFQCTYEKCKKLYHDFLKDDGTPNSTLFHEVRQIVSDSIDEFLCNIIFDFPAHGLVDEAINLGRWFAQFAERPDELLQHVGCILAAAGRREDAIRQVKENLQKFPNDAWVVISAGDAMNSLGEHKAAEEYFIKAYKMVKGKADTVEVLERIINLYRAMHMEEKSRAFEDEYAELTETTQESIKAAEKTSRNAPCLCGSGKKYKKCCMNKAGLRSS
ncbi:MAG: SEC-C metal-binding domain-containing protein [Candidatus Brocadiaceae bacterium]